MSDKAMLKATMAAWMSKCHEVEMENTNLRAELARLRGAAEDVVDADWAIVSAGRATGAYNRHMAPAVQALAAALQQQPAVRGEEQ